MNVRRLRLWSQLLVGGALLLAVWVMLVWVSARPALRGLVDLTPQQVYSVDAVTEDLLRELRSRKAALEFHLFFYPNNGQAADDFALQVERIRTRVRELTRQLLNTYQYLAGDSITIYAHDFYGDVEATRKAAQQFDYKSNEDDVVVVAVRMPGKELRFRKLALLLDLADIERPNTGAGPTKGMALPVLKRFLGEKQVSSALKSLLIEGTPVAYLLRGYSAIDVNTASKLGYSEFLTALGTSGFEVRTWDSIQQPRVPDDASLVIVLEPTSNFVDQTAQSIFDYVKRGGRAFLNFCWAGEGLNADGGKLAELLGYELSQAPVFHKIVDSRQSAGRALDGDAAVARLQLVPSDVHPTTRRFARSGRPLEVASARAVRVRAGADPAIRRESMLHTGPLAWLAFLEGGFPSYRAPQVQLHEFDVGMSFEMDVPADQKRPNAPKTGQVVLVSGLFCNNAGMPLFGEFALNICNWLTERRVLLDLKLPGYEAQYFDLKPQQYDRIGWLLVWGVPLALLLAGSCVYWRRRQ